MRTTQSTMVFFFFLLFITSRTEYKIKTREQSKNGYTSIAASSCKSTGTGEPRVGVIIPALSLVLWSNTSSLKIMLSSLYQAIPKRLQRTLRTEGFVLEQEKSLALSQLDIRSILLSFSTRPHGFPTISKYQTFYECKRKFMHQKRDRRII